MKKLLALTTLVALGGFAQAKEVKAEAKKCPASECPSACADGCCGTMVKLAVTGLDDESVAATAEAKIGAMAGISSIKTCSKSGTVMVKYDAEKMKVCGIEKAVAETGLKVVGHKATMNIKGLACQSCSNHLTTVLGKTEGIVSVDKVCHQSGQATVTFDHKKTDMEKIKAAVNTTKYKVIEKKEKEAKAADPVALR
jgi:copper chaperone CopZ